MNFRSLVGVSFYKEMMNYLVQVWTLIFWNRYGNRRNMVFGIEINILSKFGKLGIGWL